jgi:hypothetical protein
MKASVDNALLRIYYLAMIDYPTNWLEKNFQNVILKMSNIKNIDECYSIFFPTFALTLKEKEKSVEEYLKRQPKMSYPDLEGNPLSLNKLSEYINEIWEKAKKHINRKDKKVINILIKNKVINNEKDLPFENIKYSLIHKLFTYKLIPHNNQKGTNSLVMLCIVYLIETGKIGKILKKEAEKMKEIALFYACESSKSAVVNLEELWELINYLMKTDIKIDLSCRF